MDPISVRFAQESAMRQIDACTDLGELKRLTRSLVRGHFEARAMICNLLLQQAEALTQSSKASP